jgi:hypothetical protein
MVWGQNEEISWKYWHEKPGEERRFVLSYSPQRTVDFTVDFMLARGLNVKDTN